MDQEESRKRSFEKDERKSESPRKKRGSPKKVPRKFGDLSEEDVLQMGLPDLFEKDLDIVFIGINPSLDAAYVGHYYAGNSNHFWTCMNETQLVAADRKLNHLDDNYCLSQGVGFTCMVKKTTRGAADLTKVEMLEGCKELKTKLKEHQPKIACFNGKGMFEMFLGGKCSLGEQSFKLEDTDTIFYVMPSTSARAASFPRASDKFKFFLELKAIVQKLKPSD
eukprot:m.45262 g.45262  ORF g.45262 m.45262 type:complete len:222 (+) comp33578_c0_seq3:123-788(+)